MGGRIWLGAEGLQRVALQVKTAEILETSEVCAVLRNFLFLCLALFRALDAGRPHVDVVAGGAEI
jgi:hypothetical protein